MDELKYLKAIGINIKKIRLEQKISQVELAYRCDFEKSNLNRIEAGRNNLTIKTLLKISKELGVSVQDLLPKT